MIQELTKSRIRVHMGAPILGLQNSGFSLGYRFSNVMGLLEYRLNNLQPVEETQLTGAATSTVIITGKPTIGDTVTVTVNALTPTTYTVVSADTSSSDPLGSVAGNLSNAMNLQLKGVPVIASYAPALKQPYPTASTPNSTLILQAAATGATGTFTVAVSATGNTSPIALSQGVLPQPSVTFQEVQTTFYGYVPILDYLEGATGGASDLLKYSTADVVKFRPDELRARQAVYHSWRKILSDFLGVPLFPMAMPGRGVRATGMNW